MLLAQMRKIFLQQYLPTAVIWLAVRTAEGTLTGG
jgi:hypothetical protein